MQFRVMSICLLSSLIGLTACSTTKPTNLAIQNQNKQYTVIGTGQDRLTARNNAIKAAQETCPSLSKPIMISENMEYHGLANEKTGNMINKAGSILGVFMGKNINLAQDNDYQMTLEFECK